jgi:predicted PurR-regulated permease PerM
MNDTHTTDSNRVGARALTIALVAGVALLLLPFISGLMGAGILYVVAEPLLRHLTAATKTRKLAAVATVFALFIALVLPGAWIFGELLAQVPDALRELQASSAYRNLMTLRVGEIDVGAQLQAATSDMVRWSSRQTLALLGGMMGATINLVIALFGCYYLLMSGDRMWDHSRRLLPFCPTTSELLRMRFHLVTEAMLLGVVVTGVAQGTLVALALTALGFDHALFWGAVTAACSVIPMFGSGIVWLPASLYLIADERVGAAVALLAFGTVVVSNVDNVLRLVVYKRVSHIHPMVTLVGAFAGVRAFGLAGLLIGPLLVSYAIELVKIWSAGVPAGTPAQEAVLA